MPELDGGQLAEGGSTRAFHADDRSGRECPLLLLLDRKVEHDVVTMRSRGMVNMDESASAILIPHGEEHFIVGGPSLAEGAHRRHDRSLVRLCHGCNQAGCSIQGNRLMGDVALLAEP